MTPQTLLRIGIGLLPLLILSCGGAVITDDSGAAATTQGSACEPRVGVYATDLNGNAPSADINTTMANMVSTLQQSDEDLGIELVNKVTGFEEDGSVHYLVLVNTGASTYRLVDGETAVIVTADSSDGTVDWSVSANDVANWLQSDIKAAIDQHDLVTSGSGTDATVEAGSSVNIDYTVDATQGRIVAESTVGTLGGTALDDGGNSFRVSGGSVEDFALSVPLTVAAGTHTVSVESSCRYDSSTVIETLNPVSVTVTQSPLVGTWCATSWDATYDESGATAYDGDCSDNGGYIRIYESEGGLKATPLIGLCEDEVPAEFMTMSDESLQFTTRSSGSLNHGFCNNIEFVYTLSREDNTLSGSFTQNGGSQVNITYSKASSDPCLSSNWSGFNPEMLCQ